MFCQVSRSFSYIYTINKKHNKTHLKAVLGRFWLGLSFNWGTLCDLTVFTCLIFSKVTDGCRPPPLRLRMSSSDTVSFTLGKWHLRLSRLLSDATLARWLLFCDVTFVTGWLSSKSGNSSCVIPSTVSLHWSIGMRYWRSISSRVASHMSLLIASSESNSAS